MDPDPNCIRRPHPPLSDLKTKSHHIKKAASENLKRLFLIVDQSKDPRSMSLCYEFIRHALFSLHMRVFFFHKNGIHFCATRNSFYLYLPFSPRRALRQGVDSILQRHNPPSRPQLTFLFLDKRQCPH